MQVSKWLGHANFTITLNVYGGYIPEDEGGKAAPLAAPAPTPATVEAPAPELTNVFAFRRRSAG